MTKGAEKEVSKDISEEVKKEEDLDIKITEKEKLKNNTSKSKKKVLNESVYSVNELAANAKKIFGTRQECVIAALKANGKKEYAVSEAKQIIEKFLRQEVQ